MPNAMNHQCPDCNRLIYNRREKLCGYCGASIPEELRFTPEEIATVDRELKNLEETRKQREFVKEAAIAAAAGQVPAIIPIIVS